MMLFLVILAILIPLVKLASLVKLEISENRVL